jgi:hypothetical protein
MDGRVGPVKVHWPMTMGYYGGVGLAVAAGIIEWPVALFIGAVPVVKLFKDRAASTPVRYFVDLFQGAAKPVGGDADSMMELARREPPPRSTQRRRADAAQGARRSGPAQGPRRRPATASSAAKV